LQGTGLALFFISMTSTNRCISNK